MFLCRFLVRPIVGIGKIGGRHHQVLFHKRKSVRPHVPLVLVQDDGPSRNLLARLVVDSNDEFRPLSQSILFALFPQVDLARFELCLAVSAEHLVHHGSENAGPGGEECIERVQHAHFRIGAEHGVRVDPREAVSNVVDDRLDGFGQKGVSRCRRNESVPQAHSPIHGRSRLVLWNHEPNVRSNGEIEVGFQHDIHVGIYPAADQQHAVAKQIGLEGPRSECFVGLSNLRWKVRAEKLEAHFVRVELVFPPGLLEGFDEAAHVWVLFRSDGFVIGLVHDAGNQSGWLPGENGWADDQRLGNEFLLHRNVAEGLAVARTFVSARLAVGSLLVAETVAAYLVRGKAVVLQQSFEKVGREKRVSLGSLVHLFGNRCNVRKIFLVELALAVVEWLWQIRGLREDLVRKEQVFGHHCWGIGDGIVNTATKSIGFGAVLRQSIAAECVGGSRCRVLPLPQRKEAAGVLQQVPARLDRRFLDRGQFVCARVRSH
mmetsp:Transcript_12626/g.35811  ORF Transcript_12626/g.35811 Transcript_12626/m.35811 type:complete len:487 (-) Transcript_12626:412-1872(-)